MRYRRDKYVYDPKSGLEALERFGWKNTDGIQIVTEMVAGRIWEQLIKVAVSVTFHYLSRQTVMKSCSSEIKVIWSQQWSTFDARPWTTVSLNIFWKKPVQMVSDLSSTQQWGAGMVVLCWVYFSIAHTPVHCYDWIRQNCITFTWRIMVFAFSLGTATQYET
jgi:hypothetical protein